MELKYRNLEKIVKGESKIVFPDLLTCDNIYIDENSDLVQKMEDAYDSSIQIVDDYISSEDSEKLAAPLLLQEGKNDWNNALLDKMKEETDGEVKNLNKYLQSSQANKIVSPNLDPKSWKTFGEEIVVYINEGMSEGILKYEAI